MALTKHRIGVAVVVVFLLAAAVVAAFAAGVFKTPLTPAERAARAAAQLIAKEHAEVATSDRLVNVHLPVSSTPPRSAPTPPLQLFKRPLAPVEVLGFVPYWESAAITPAELSDVSTISLFGVEVAQNGSFLESGPGWTDYSATGYRSLVEAAHAAHDQVLFTISTTSENVIRRLTTDPSATSGVLARALAGAVATGGLSGVDIDIEGTQKAQRSGFVTFVRDLTTSLRADGMNGTIVIDCYPQAASDPSNFYDIARLAPLVDQIFVMAYDMERYSNSSATAPIDTADLGFSDVQSVLQYLKVVPARKLILGVPFYGIDYTTASGRNGARALTPAPLEATYETIAAAARPQLWDPVSETVWTHFKIGKTWHETWFDTPVSLAFKPALVAHYRLGGIGIWALGFEGAAPEMLRATDGDVAPRRVPLSN